MTVHPITWLISAAIVVAVIALDFVLHVRRPHTPTFRESALWVTIYATLSVAFGVGLAAATNARSAGEFFAGYLTEYSLSLDNLFVFLLVIGAFRVPKEAEQKVLLVGIAIALVFRAAFILAGAAMIARFTWVFFIFGGFLLYTAAKLIVDHLRAARRNSQDDEFHEPRLVRLARRILPLSEDYASDRITVRHQGRRLVTPLLLVMIAIGSVDLLFALDSIPAIFGLTKEPYLVFMTNACALLGLRQLYFLIGGLLERLRFLAHGLAVILAFIGVKLILEALAANELPFINSGRPLAVPEIPTWLSLAVIGCTMAAVTITSRLAPAPQGKGASPAEGRSPG
ncbi:MAG: TerC/Alx family metal homeostasis membrane protein [Micrococcales bacterium]|nr:TerC/Alx family metal homeostasis membrane protein [Micrococcales bacterium]